VNKTLENFNIFRTVSTYPVCTFIEPEFPTLLMSYPVLLVQANLFPVYSSLYYPFIPVFQVVTSQASTCQNVVLYIFIIQFKYINQQDATVSQVYYLTFMYGPTCFGRPSAHHQERITALGASGFTVGEWRLERCWSWSGRPRPTTLQLPLFNGKTRGS